jgi:cytochrome b
MVAISKTSWIKGWDPLVRFGHWTLVIAFAVAYLTGEEEGDASELHEWAGYVVGGIVAWRVVWGLTGPRYARFSDFVTGPIQALRYLWSEPTGHARRYLGHSPAGGVMVLALLVSLALTVVTGLIADQGYGNASSRQGLSSVVAQALAGETKSDASRARWPGEGKHDWGSACSARKYFARPYRVSRSRRCASQLRSS